MLDRGCGGASPVSLDPLSLAANIIAVTFAGFKVAKGLHSLADGIGFAGREVRIYADEIDSFAKLLGRVKEQLSQGGDECSYEKYLLQDILHVCKRVLEPINRIQEQLNPLLVSLHATASKLKHFTLRVQWMFSSKDNTGC
jgi:predicted hotdog family 3-hydroxylacyl-ACP dehydratase